MTRWDRLLDSYVEDYRAMLGVSPQSVAYTEARLHRRGRWLKGRHHETPATVFLCLAPSNHHPFVLATIRFALLITPFF